MKRFSAFTRLVVALTALMFGVWYLSAALLPQGILRPFFAGRFSSVVGGFTFGQVFLVNFLIGFLGIQFMNLFRVGKYPGGLYILPIFWIIYGLLLGTNSFVFAGEPVPFSITVLWARTGFGELLAYTLGYEASRDWMIWEQQNVFSPARRLDRKNWPPHVQDLAYWGAGLILLILSVAREVS